MSHPTPGPCGCTTKENGFGYTEIVYCALHAQAPAMREALDESVKLQSHYAELLNQWDGGQRIIFKDAAEWMTRLAMTPAERVKDAEARAILKAIES